MRRWIKRGAIAVAVLTAAVFTWICLLCGKIPLKLADWSLGQYRGAAKSDRLEVVGLTEWPDGGPIGTVCRVALTGDDLKPFLEAWRGLQFEADDSSMCHEPVYRLKFYSGWMKRLDVTVCWHCDNMFPASLYPPAPNIAFNASKPEAKAMLELLRARCPITVSENSSVEWPRKPVKAGQR